MTHFRQTSLLAAIAVALLAGAATANAQTTVITREPVQTETVVTTQPFPPGVHAMRPGAGFSALLGPY